MAIYGYLRVSSNEQADGTSITTQERRVRAVAEFRSEDGMTEVFSDPGVSGSVPLFDRPGGKKLVGVAQRGDTIIVSKLDRIFRSAQDGVEWFNYFTKHGIDLILCDMGTEPITQNGASKMFFTMMVAMAEFERERIQERCDEGRRAKRASGGHVGGKPPFGFMILGTGKSARCVPDPALADALNELRRCWTAGTTLRGAVQYLHSKCGVRISFNQVDRVYKKFEQDRDDCAEATERDDARRTGQDVRREESLSE
jgi:putative DNA-invertase from lambdoid prophage Rac